MHVLRWMLVVVWLSLMVLGMRAMLIYQGKSGEFKIVDAPMASSLVKELPLNQPSLVMFIHPQCPCSRASIGELETIIAGAQGKVSALLLFMKPDAYSDSWVETDSWHTARRIPGVRLKVDPEGTIARQMNVTTSGHTLVYNHERELEYSGGITMSRGHIGDNQGRRAVLSLLNSGKSDIFETPVFGCALFAGEQNDNQTTCCKRQKI